MVTPIDKALQDFFISLVTLVGLLTQFDFSNWQGLAVSVVGAAVKAYLTWQVPNKAVTK